MGRIEICQVTVFLWLLKLLLLLFCSKRRKKVNKSFQCVIFHIYVIYSNNALYTLLSKEWLLREDEVCACYLELLLKNYLFFWFLVLKQNQEGEEKAEDSIQKSCTTCSLGTTQK